MQVNRRQRYRGTVRGVYLVVLLEPWSYDELSSSHRGKGQELSRTVKGMSRQEVCAQRPDFWGSSLPFSLSPFIIRNLVGESNKWGLFLGNLGTRVQREGAQNRSRPPVGSLRVRGSGRDSGGWNCGK